MYVLVPGFLRGFVNRFMFECECGSGVCFGTVC